MLTWLGFGMVVSFMTLIMIKRMSPLVALILVPLAFGLLGGFGTQLDEMVLDGIKNIAPTGIMLVFAIMYFGVMIDAGLFDPLVRLVLRLVGGDPLKVVVGTAILAMIISLDGDGSTTYMITVSAMLPLYHRLRINVLRLTCVTILAGGVMNLTPWGGPAARAASALQVDVIDLFLPMLPAIGAALIAVVLLAWWLGLCERRRVGMLVWGRGGPAGDLNEGDTILPTLDTHEELRRPRLIWFNAALTVLLMVSLLMGVLPLPVLFMIGFAVAVTLNYPQLALQRQRVASYASNVLPVVSVIFAAGIFAGVLSGSGMVEAMANDMLALIPKSMGPHLAVITGLLSIPLTFFISNDAFYYGVLPVLAEGAAAYGISAEEMARASLIGQPVHLLSPLVPSTYLLVGLAGVDFAEHQRFTLKWAALIALVLLAAGLAFAVFPLTGMSTP